MFLTAPLGFPSTVWEIKSRNMFSRACDSVPKVYLMVQMLNEGQVISTYVLLVLLPGVERLHSSQKRMMIPSRFTKSALVSGPQEQKRGDVP